MCIESCILLILLVNWLGFLAIVYVVSRIEEQD